MSLEINFDNNRRDNWIHIALLNSSQTIMTNKKLPYGICQLEIITPICGSKKEGNCSIIWF